MNVWKTVTPPRPVVWGQPSQRVCWLVGPSVMDVWLPHDHTLMYILSEVWQYGAPGRTIISTIDREEAAMFSRELYVKRHPHVLATHWFDSEGRYVKKMPKIAEIKRAIEDGLITEYESQGEFQLENHE